MKFSRVTLMIWSIGSDVSQPLPSRKSKMSRVTTSAVKRLALAATPMVRVTPKPLMGPVPIYIRITDEISVVTCESKMVRKARS